MVHTNVYISFLFLEYLPIFFRKRKKVTFVVRGTVYTKSAYIVPVSGVPADLPFRLKKWLLVLEEEQCIHNVYTSILFLEYLPIYLCNRKIGYWRCKRNGVDKMCIHHSCY